jgi:hypothetical protein
MRPPCGDKLRTSSPMAGGSASALLRLHSRFGPPDRSAAQGDPCKQAPALPATRRAARQLPDPSTTLWMDSSSTGASRPRGARPLRLSYQWDHLPKNTFKAPAASCGGGAYAPRLHTHAANPSRLPQSSFHLCNISRARVSIRVRSRATSEPVFGGASVATLASQRRGEVAGMTWSELSIWRPGPYRTSAPKTASHTCCH